MAGKCLQQRVKHQGKLLLGLNKQGPAVDAPFCDDLHECIDDQFGRASGVAVFQLFVDAFLSRHKTDQRTGSANACTAMDDDRHVGIGIERIDAIGQFDQARWTDRAAIRPVFVVKANYSVRI